jgi:hypothetical protein
MSNMLFLRRPAPFKREMRLNNATLFCNLSVIENCSRHSRRMTPCIQGGLGIPMHRLCQDSRDPIQLFLLRHLHRSRGHGPLAPPHCCHGIFLGLCRDAGQEGRDGCEGTCREELGEQTKPWKVQYCSTSTLHH